MKARALLAAAIVVGSIGGTPAQAAVTDRLYLMATDEGETYWTPDLTDPELQALTAGCGRNLSSANDPYCLPAGFPPRAQILYFSQAALFDAPLTLSPSRPLRFRFVLEAYSPQPYTVHLFLQRNSSLTESQAAIEVAPGVFEGTLAAGGVIDPTEFTFFGLALQTRDLNTRVEVRTAGESWIQLPEAVSVQGMREMRARDVYAPAPGSIRTDERLFRFNDADYELRTFDVSRSSDSSFTIETTREAQALYAWVEGYADPFFYRVVRQNPTEAHGPTDNANIEMYVNGARMAYGSFGSLAETAVPAGTLRFDIAPYVTFKTGTLEAYVLVLYGERTLRSMRWRFFSGAAFAWNLPVTTSCFNPTEQLVTTPASRAFEVKLAWESVSALPQRWTVSYELPEVGGAPCGGHASGTKATFARPGQALWLIGTSPAQNSWFASVYDARFEAEATFTYAP